MSEEESSDVGILVRKSHERIKSYFKNDFEYDQLPVPRSNEFIECITNNKNVDEFQYFVEEIEKLHPDNRRKVFYNIAQKIKEISDA